MKYWFPLKYGLIFAFRFVPSTAAASSRSHTSLIFLARVTSSIPSFTAARIFSVTSSMRTRMEAVIPGFVNSSFSDLAQKPSLR